mgnify:CR=1 FL=1
MSIPAPAVTDHADAIMRVIQAWSAQHTTRNIAQYMALFSPAETTVLIGPEGQERCVGLDAIRAQAERDWQLTDYLTFVWNWHTVVVQQSVAWIAAEGLSRLKMHGESMEFNVRLTAVLVAHAEQWRIAQHHLSIPVG